MCSLMTTVGSRNYTHFSEEKNEGQRIYVYSTLLELAIQIPWLFKTIILHHFSKTKIHVLPNSPVHFIKLSDRDWQHLYLVILVINLQPFV